MEFRDEKNGLMCDLVVKPGGQNQGMIASWFSSAKRQVPTDYVRGQIKRYEPGESSSRNEAKQKAHDAEILSDVQGTWLGCIEFDNDRLWDWQEDYVSYEPQPVRHPLPSDCRYRLDVQHLAAGDTVKAQDVKTELEEKQRHEAKLRKEGEKILKRREKQKRKNKIPTREPRIFKKPEIHKEKEQEKQHSDKNGKGKKKHKHKKEEHKHLHNSHSKVDIPLGQ